MSRLIDADGLTREICRDQCEKDGCGSRCELINYVENAPTVNGWISVKDRQPVETHSIFYRFYGTQKWSNSMWREQSDKVLAAVAFKDGTKTVTTGQTHDGVWNTTISRTLEPVVTHWMPMPEAPKEKENANAAPRRGRRFVCQSLSFLRQSTYFPDLTRASG